MRRHRESNDAPTARRLPSEVKMIELIAVCRWFSSFAFFGSALLVRARSLAILAFITDPIATATVRTATTSTSTSAVGNNNSSATTRFSVLCVACTSVVVKASVRGPRAECSVFGCCRHTLGRAKAKTHHLLSVASAQSFEKYAIVSTPNAHAPVKRPRKNYTVTSHCKSAHPARVLVKRAQVRTVTRRPHANRSVVRSGHKPGAAGRTRKRPSESSSTCLSSSWRALPLAYCAYRAAVAIELSGERPVSWVPHLNHATPCPRVPSRRARACMLLAHVSGWVGRDRLCGKAF